MTTKMTKFGRYMRLVVMANQLRIKAMKGHEYGPRIVYDDRNMIYGDHYLVIRVDGREFDLSQDIPGYSSNFRTIRQVAGQINRAEKMMDFPTANYFAGRLEEVYQKFIAEKVEKISDQTRLRIIVAAMQLNKDELRKTWPMPWNRLDEGHSDFWRMMQVALTADTYIWPGGRELLAQVCEELGDIVI